MRKCGYCGKEIEDSQIKREYIDLWAPDVGHECDYIEETCPNCGWHSECIEDQLNSWAY